MRLRSAVVADARSLLTGERSDPRIAQAVFWVPVALDLLLRVHSGLTADAALAGGLWLVAVATVLALASPRGRTSDLWVALVPLLDIAAVGVLRLSPVPGNGSGVDSGIGVAVVYPAIWLGLQLVRRGWLLTAAALLTTYVVPAVLVPGPTGHGLAQAAQTTLVALIASGAGAALAQAARSHAAAAHTNAARLRQALHEVVEQRRITESIVTSVDVGLIAIGAQGGYESMNPRHREFMGLAFPDGHGGVAGQLGHVFAADGVTVLEREDMPTIRTIGGEDLRDYVIWVGRDPGERRALAVSSQRHFGDDGELAGAVMAYHDITELVLASRIKEEFVASVSHELRTPLTSIIGYTDIVLDDCVGLDEETRHYLGTVQRNAKRLHRLVDDLLSSALDSVSAVLEVQELPLSKVLRLAALEAGRIASASGVALTLQDPEACADVLVEGDAERLTQVFDNLFSNAIKYTGPGGSVVATLARDGEQLVVRVSDTGRGIPPEELDAIFAKFFRNRGVATEAIPGVGLGLAITKAIVTAHDGSISVRSTLGAGSTFEVRLPIHHPAAIPGAA